MTREDELFFKINLLHYILLEGNILWHKENRITDANLKTHFIVFFFILSLEVDDSYRLSKVKRIFRMCKENPLCICISGLRLYSSQNRVLN